MCYNQSIELELFFLKKSLSNMNIILSLAVEQIDTNIQNDFINCK